MPEHVFFEKTVLQRKFGDQLLQVAHLLAQAFNLARGRLAAYADRIVIRQDGETVAEHPRSLGRGEIAYDSWHYVPILTRKPGALRNGAPFKGWQLPGALGRIRAWLTGCDVGSRFPTTIPKAGGLLDLL